MPDDKKPPRKSHFFDISPPSGPITKLPANYPPQMPRIADELAALRARRAGEKREQEPVAPLAAEPAEKPEPPAARKQPPSNPQRRQRWILDTIEGSEPKRSLIDNWLAGWLIDKWVEAFGALGSESEFLNLRHKLNGDLRALKKAHYRHRGHPRRR